MQTKRIYETDSMAREFSARVIRCFPLKGSRSDEAKFGVILDETAFFPEGGGQLADTGNLGSAAVFDVQKQDGEIVHFVDVPLEEGAEVLGVLNWDQRFRRMQNHTGEHLVSGIVHTAFGYDNVGFHLGNEEVTVDFSGVITDEELQFVEYVANRVVALNRKVIASYPTEEELKTLEYRSKIELNEAVRIVTIEGWDCCACCAPHVNRTGEIGGIKILDSENWKGGVRLKMLCGLDAISDYRKRLGQTARISQLLSVPQLETAAAVERLMQTLQAEKEEKAKLQRALLQCKIDALQETPGNLVIFESNLDQNALRSLVNAGVARCGGVCAAFSGNDKDGYRYIIGSKNVALRAWCKEFHAAMHGKGGGSDEMIQGTVQAKAEELLEQLR